MAKNFTFKKQSTPSNGYPIVDVKYSGKVCGRIDGPNWSRSKWRVQIAVLDSSEKIGCILPFRLIQKTKSGIGSRATLSDSTGFTCSMGQAHRGD